MCGEHCCKECLHVLRHCCKEGLCVYSQSVALLSFTLTWHLHLGRTILDPECFSSGREQVQPQSKALPE